MKQFDKIIEVSSISKKFGSFQAVKDVSFSVYPGDVFGFLGPNGAGKSTTIRCLLSLIKPNSGNIKVFNKSLYTNRFEILSKVGCIIEKPDFYKYLSAIKNLELFARISGVEVSRKKIQEIIEFVGLASRENHKVKGFSHGMKQRLGIAQTLLHDPELIILDEPTTGLDPQGIKEIRDLILRLKNEFNKTVLLSSHQLHEIELIANRMVIINKGETLVEGEVHELIQKQILTVDFEVSDIQKASVLIEKNNSNKSVLTNKEMISVELSKDEIPKIVELFSENQIQVYSVEPRKKLEDYFINITKE